MSFADTVTVANGQTAAGGPTTASPLTIGGVYNTSAPTLTNGEVGYAQMDASANTKVNVVNGVSSGTAGSASANVISVQGISGMTPVQTQAAALTSGGPSYSNLIAPATPAVSTVKSGAGNVVNIVAFNQLSTPVFLKMFDVSGSITLGTTASTYQFMIPGNTGGAGFVIPLAQGGRSHANSIKYAVTLNISTTDNTSITSNSVIVDVSYN